MDKEKAQKLSAIFFNKELPVHIVTKDDSWVNGYIYEYESTCIIVDDRYTGTRVIDFDNIEIIEQFTGDLSTLKRREI